ncbi:MAG TPA: chemotaxis response regulator protein-glutamate methylesterase [Verrucomicrobiae bacterium]|nr:chemotaxis response regulator protein-glutamate methylesterase [Verrucomicrobiae bacterium]
MRIAIVNDSLMAAEAMRRIILDAAEHQIAWTASDGAEAVHHCLLDTPDLVLMDLIMPGTNGVQATRQIMARCPCAILIVTANVTDNCSAVFEAMGAGALDAVNTPVLQWPGSCKGDSDLLAKIETIRKLIGVGSMAPRRNRPQPHAALPEGRLIAIGASAGGPAALARILDYLPQNFRSPVVIVQHVDAQFAPALASWLDNQTPLRVRLAQEGDVPGPGTILLARGDQHLVCAAQGRLAYSEQPSDSSYRPSVDVFLQSVHRNWPGEIIGVLLTGMGRDGAQGLLELRRNGHHTIAQNQASCAVYGMPKAAAELRAAVEILSLDQIALRLRMYGTQGVRLHV